MTWSTFSSACTTGTCNSLLVQVLRVVLILTYYLMKDPTGVAIDTTGNMWIADRLNNRIVYCSGIHIRRKLSIKLDFFRIPEFGLHFLDSTPKTFFVQKGT